LEQAVDCPLPIYYRDVERTANETVILSLKWPCQMGTASTTSPTLHLQLASSYASTSRNTPPSLRPSLNSAVTPPTPVPYPNHSLSSATPSSNESTLNTHHATSLLYVGFSPDVERYEEKPLLSRDIEAPLHAKNSPTIFCGRLRSDFP